MKKVISGTLLLLLLAFQVANLNAQIIQKSNIKLINSREKILKGIDYYDEKEYEKAEKIYAQIPKSDSLYPLALYERALTCYTLDKYDSAIAFCEEGLTLSKNKSDFYGLLGSIYDDKKLPLKAIEVFNLGLKQFPYNQMMHFNLGVAYFRLDSLDLAEKEFLTSAKLDPFHFKTHFFLGELNERKGRYIESLLCYYMASIINPERTIAIVQLEKLLNGESELVSLASLYPIKEEERIPEFDALEDIIKSKIALNPKFKTKAKINDIVVKQGQMLFNKLVYNPKIDNFYMNFYVQVYTQIRDKKFEEPFFFALFSGYESEGIQSWLKKKEKKVKAMYLCAASSIKTMRDVGLVNLQNAKDTLYYLYDEKGNLNNFGHYSDKDKKTKEGKWTWVHSNGGLEGEVFYVNGKEEGEIVVYNSEGIKTSTTTKKDGLFEGPYITYYDNGVHEMESTMKEDKIEGSYKKFYTSGQLKEEGFVKKGKLNGPVKGYYVGGQLQYTMNYTNGEADGMYTKYYPDGKVRENFPYVKDKSTGAYLLYYPDSTLSKSGMYEKEKPVGKWKEYYPNGILQSEYTRNNKSEYIDTQKDYYADGKLQMEIVYNGSKSTATWYNRIGKKYFMVKSEDQKTTAFEAYDENGKVIDKGEVSSKTLNFRMRNPMGVLTREGKIVSGKYEGQWIYYNNHGAKIESRSFKNDEIEGNDSVFWQNGTLKFVTPYKKGNIDGYYEEYFLNGSLCREGWYTEGLRQGMWKTYNIDGTLSEINYYANGDFQGWQEDYFPNGKLNEQSYYEFDHFSAKILFDSTGKVFNKSDLTHGNGIYELKAQNGKLLIHGQLEGGVFNGKTERFYSNGQPKMKATYLSDQMYGNVEKFDENGLISVKSNYYNDKLWGNYETFENGKLEYTCKYYNDNNYGSARWIYPNGKTEIEYNYLDDELDGKSSFFAPDGQLMFAVNFIDNSPISYTYKDKAGALVKPIPIDKDTVHVVAYYQSGKKSADFYYYYGVRTGAYELFYPNGQTYLKYNRIGLEYNGIFTENYQNGKPNKVKTYYYGQLHGASKSYYENGNIKSDEFYNCNMLHGTAKYYDSTGKLTITRQYFYGVLISETKL